MNLSFLLPDALQTFQRILCSLTALSVVFLMSCATISPLSISEATLEDYLREEVVKFDREQLKNDSPLSIRLSQVDVTLGPDNRDVVVLDVGGEAVLNAIITQVPVTMKLKVEGAPVYKSEEKAIYIKRLKLLNSQIDAEYFKGDFKPLTDNLMKVVTRMLEEVPVYRLDETHWTGKLASLANMDIKVAPGKLVFVPAE